MDPYQELINTAAAFIGVHEEGGNNHGEWVEEFQKAVDGKANGESWCAAMVSYCVKWTNYVVSGESKLRLAEHCLTMWNWNPSAQRDYPQAGFLVVWQHGTSSNGHIGIVEAVNGDGTITTIEGNTSPSQGVERDGDGVYRKIRMLNSTGAMHIVGFLDPFA